MIDKPILRSGPTGPYDHGYKMCMVKYTDGTIRGITWHRYIYESKYGRQPSGTNVHHKNEDKTDNRLKNLEILTIGNHTRCHNKLAPKSTYVCPWCGNSFDRNDSMVRHNQKSQKKAGPFCDRSCGASWGREKQLGRL